MDFVNPEKWGQDFSQPNTWIGPIAVTQSAYDLSPEGPLIDVLIKGLEQAFKSAPKGRPKYKPIRSRGGPKPSFYKSSIDIL